MRAYLGSKPRWPVTSRMLSDPVRAVAWSEIASTILLGSADTLIGPEERAWGREAVADVRDIDRDHFILYSLHEELAAVTLEGTSLLEPYLPCPARRCVAVSRTCGAWLLLPVRRWAWRGGCMG